MKPKSILKSGRTEKGFDSESDNLSYLEEQKETKKRITGSSRELTLYRVYREFRLTKQDDYFRVTFEASSVIF